MASVPADLVRFLEVRDALGSASSGRRQCRPALNGVTSVREPLGRHLAAKSARAPRLKSPAAAAVTAMAAPRIGGRRRQGGGGAGRRAGSTCEPTATKLRAGVARRMLGGHGAAGRLLIPQPTTSLSARQIEAPHRAAVKGRRRDVVSRERNGGSNPRDTEKLLNAGQPSIDLKDNCSPIFYDAWGWVNLFSV